MSVVTIDKFDSDSFEDWGSDDWEDPGFIAEIHKKYPNWHLIKIVNFNEQKFTSIDGWLTNNVRFGAYKRVGWRSHCAYSVGIIFESGKDAMIFKLRWH